MSKVFVFPGNEMEVLPSSGVLCLITVCPWSSPDACGYPQVCRSSGPQNRHWQHLKTLTLNLFPTLASSGRSRRSSLSLSVSDSAELDLAGTLGLPRGRCVCIGQRG